MKMTWIILLLICTAPSAARADLAAAKAAYLKGSALEQARSYRAAFAEYSNALKADPTYIYAWKQIGNCYYYMGYKEQAVQAYRRYLAAVPGDASLKAFVGRLTGGSAAPAPTSTAPKAKGVLRMQGWPAPSHGITGYNFYTADEEFASRDKLKKLNPRPITTTAYAIQGLELNKTYFMFLSMIKDGTETEPQAQGGFVASPN